PTVTAITRVGSIGAESDFRLVNLTNLGNCSVAYDYHIDFSVIITVVSVGAVHFSAEIIKFIIEIADFGNTVTVVAKNLIKICKGVGLDIHSDAVKLGVTTNTIIAIVIYVWSNNTA
ncbi:MAG: hypothetical protein IKZ01_06220, partial [Anaerotignum sp.]|nr:hypothetical protein [Anaerotignum sp.]